jgi:hypothetical protein
MLTQEVFKAAINLTTNHDPDDCLICGVLKDALKAKAAARRFNGQDKPVTEEDAAETPKPAPNPFPFDPPKGNRERESVFRVTIAVEKALKCLPNSSARVAGYLQGQGFKGDKTAGNNALVSYLSNALNEFWTEGTLYGAMRNVRILVEANGIIVENDDYQVALNPPPWLDTFMCLLRSDEYKELLA